MSKLSASDLHVRLGARDVLCGLTFDLRQGQLVLLAGRNGAGKSTLLRALLGACRPDRGLVLLEERPLAVWPDRERARRIAFVPQGIDTPFEFTGRELVTMGRHAHRGRGDELQRADLDAIDRAIAAVDAASFAGRPITTLSGGEQRRIAVARALATEAPFLLLDEPTTNLDLEHALQLVALLRQLAAGGRGILVASHDLNLFARHCDQVALLHEGRIYAAGSPHDVLWPGNVEVVFGVRSASPQGFFPREFRLPPGPEAPPAG
ncbi:MAG: ABC transporter ATP-binding protein [Planctomycetota bacterium]